MNSKIVTWFRFFPLVVSFTSTYAFAQTTTTNPYENALSEYSSGNAKTALIHVKNALKITPDNLSARLLFAKILSEQGELSASEEQYKRAIALKADPTLLILPYARVLFLQSKYDELLDKIKVGNFSNDIKAEIYAYRGKSFEQLQNITKAKTQFTEALALKKDSLNAIIGLANIADAENDQKAFDYYLNLAKEIAPNNSQVWFYQGEYYRSIKQNKQALAALDQAVKLNENNIEAKRSRAAVNIDLANYPEAEKDINAILAQTPKDPFTLLLKAFYLKRVNKKREANEILQSTSYLFSQIDLEKFNQFSPLLFIEGLTHYLLDDIREAKKSFTLYLAKSPNSLEAKEILAEIALKENNPNKTLELLQTINSKNYSLRSATLLMIAYVENKNFSQAITTFHSLDEALKQNGTILSLYTKSLISNDEPESAIALLEKRVLEQPDSIDLQLMLGYHYLQYEYYDKALNIAKKLNKQKTLSLSALNFIGVTYQSNQENTLAIAYYKKALMQSPFDLLTLTNLIQLYISDGFYDEAFTLSTEYLRKNPNEVKILNLHANCLVKMENFSQAIVAYEQLNKLSPKNLSNKYQLIDLYLQSQQPESALNEIAKVKRFERLSTISLIAEAKAYLLMKEKTRAAKALNIAFGLNLEEPDKLIKIAELQIQANDWEYFDRTIKRIVELKGESEQIAILKSLVLFRKGDKKSAIALLENLKNKTYKSYYHLANFYTGLKGFDKSITYAELSYQKHENSLALALLTKLYWIQKKQEKTLQLLDNWLINHPYDNTTRKVYANLLTQIGDITKAKSQYEIVLKNKPDNLFSLNNLAMLLLKEENYSEAKKLALKAVEVNPHDAVVNDTLGWVLVLNNQPAEGLTYLRESSARDVNNLTTKYHIAIALIKLKKTSQAKKELERLINKSFPEQEQARQQLKTLSNIAEY